MESSGAEMVLQSCPCLEARRPGLAVICPSPNPHQDTHTHTHLLLGTEYGLPLKRAWPQARLFSSNEDNAWLGAQLRALSHWDSQQHRDKHLSSKEESRQHTRASTITITNTWGMRKPQTSENGREGLSRQIKHHGQRSWNGEKLELLK